MKDRANDGIIRDCLVAVVNNDRDLERFAEERRYRIPARAVGHTVAAGALAETNVLALYQTAAVAAGLPGTIELWGEIDERIVVPRRVAVPDEPNHPAADEDYHLIRLKSIERLAAPIISHRPRRITFLRTTRGHLLHASDINELIVGTPGEEKLWRALRDAGEFSDVERRYYMRMQDVVMEVDFAIFRDDRGLGIQCREGESRVVADPGGVPDAWRVLRFSPGRLNNELAGCLHEIGAMVARMR